MTKVNQTFNVKDFKVPVLIGGGTYGYHNEDTNKFSCTHGAWSCKISLLSEGRCKLHMSHIKRYMTYQVIDSIPEDFIR